VDLPSDTLVASAPGRICLFGEHQDYLGLPVVPCAISLRITLTATPRADRIVRIDLPDIKAEDSFSLAGPLSYTKPRDYFRSSVNVLVHAGFTFSRGCDCNVRGRIPVNTGTASSSALVVAWIALLARMSDQQASLSPEECARHAHTAEVLEFGEPGGMMDHLAAAYGGILAIDFTPTPAVSRQHADLGSFVLGNSGEPKDTTGILARVKHGVLDAAALLARNGRPLSLATATQDDIRSSAQLLTPEQAVLLDGTLRNRSITTEARKLLLDPFPDRKPLGVLLSNHHAVLRDMLRISTPKIDRMLDAAMAAGAYGGKINGSGGGGCMFAYTPDRAEFVAEAIARVGGEPFIVNAGEGVRCTTGMPD
jgi:galactokinase